MKDKQNIEKMFTSFDLESSFAKKLMHICGRVKSATLDHDRHIGACNIHTYTLIFKYNYIVYMLILYVDSS